MIDQFQLEMLVSIRWPDKKNAKNDLFGKNTLKNPQKSGIGASWAENDATQLDRPWCSVLGGPRLAANVQ